MMSFRLPCAALLSSALIWSQSPAQAAKKSQDTPTLRAVAVLEWTPANTDPSNPDEPKPKTSRLVPIAIYDGEQLQDAGLYLARPEPLSLAGEVEYQLRKNGKTTGLFIIKSAAQEEGSWVGYGEWKPAPAAKPAFAATAKVDEDDQDDDKPVLHRKKHDDDNTTSNPSSTGTTTSKPADDSDRPQLHKKDDSGSSNDSAGSSSDPDRPVMKKPKPKSEDEDIGHVTALPKITDPDRPRLQRGKDNSQSLKVLPSLMGLPPDMRQTVGVSDQKDRPDHPWSYTWSNPADEARMKALLEDQARLALGLTTPAPAPKPAPTRRTSPTTRTTTTTTAGKSGTAGKSAQAKKAAPAKSAQPKPAPTPIPLEGEQFRVFELAYGSGATFVLSAHTANPDPKQQKFVTLIAQPDLYGNLAILHKSVTDASHLDETPRMILIDAVDALADNRGELLFELRGATQRQFTLYRVLRGTTEQIFQTTSNPFGTIATQ
jgi:hypothetical protein